MSLLKSIGILLGGSAAGQVISILAIPVLSRLYDPGAFGLLAAIMSSVSICAVIVHGRYHLVIPVAQDDEEARTLFYLAIYLTFILAPCFATAITMFLGGDSVDVPVAMLLALVVSMTIATSLIDVFAYQRARYKRFKTSATISVARPMTTVSVQLIAASFAKWGLVLGAFCGTVVSIALSLWSLRATPVARLKMPGISALRGVARKYSDYPLIGVPQGALAAISMNAMPLLILKFAGAAWAGQYWVAFRLLVSPVALFNGAYRQAVLRDMKQKTDAGTIRLARKHTLVLAVTTSVFALVLFFFAEALIPQLLGTDWQPAGVIVGWLAISIAADVIKIPSLCVLQSRNRLKPSLIAETGIFLLRYSVVLPLLIFGNIIEAVMAYSLIGAVLWCAFSTFFLLGSPRLSLNTQG